MSSMLDPPASAVTSRRVALGKRSLSIWTHQGNTRSDEELGVVYSVQDTAESETEEDRNGSNLVGIQNISPGSLALAVMRSTSTRKVTRGNTNVGHRPSGADATVNPPTRMAKPALRLGHRTTAQTTNGKNVISEYIQAIGSAATAAHAMGQKKSLVRKATAHTITARTPKLIDRTYPGSSRRRASGK